MLSLKRSLDEAEARRQLALTYNRVVCSTLESIKQYVIETDKASAKQFRNYIGQTLDLMRASHDAPTAEAAEEWTANVRGVLRDHRDHVTRYIERMRGDLSITAQTLNEMMQAVQEGGSENRLQDEINRLQSAVHSNSLIEIRTGVQRSLESLSGCVEQLRREKDSVIAQLKDEIRTLHRAAEQTRYVALGDAATGVYKREEFVKLVRREIVAGRAIGVVHIWVRNLQEMSGSHSPSIIDQLLAAFCKRVRNSIPAETTLSRWTSDVFCIILPAALTQQVAAEVLGSCAGQYSCMQEGASRTLYIQVQTTCAYSRSNEDPDDFVQKLESLHGKC